MLHPSDSSERASVDGYQLSFVVLSCNLQGLIQVRSSRYLPSEYPCHVPKVAQVEGVELVDGQAFFSCAAGKKEVPIFWGERLLLLFLFLWKHKRASLSKSKRFQCKCLALLGCMAPAASPKS